MDFSDHRPVSSPIRHSQVPSCAALRVRLRRSSFSRDVISMSRRSSITAASISSGMENTIMKSWIVSAFSAGELVRNGPRPCTAPQIAQPVTIRRKLLVPRAPARTAAQRTKGSGTYGRMGEVLKPACSPLKTRAETQKETCGEERDLQDDARSTPAADRRSPRCSS